MDLRRSKNELYTYCYISASMCEIKRNAARKQKMGRPTQCKPQPIAFCFQVARGIEMSRQAMCTRTAEDCQSLYELAQDSLVGVAHLAECQGLLNTDRFDSLNDWTDFRPAPSTP